MSCIFIVTPFVISNWAVLSALVGGPAAQMGYRMIRSASKSKSSAEVESGQNIELALANSEVMTDQMRRGESMVLGKGDIRITISLDAMGRMKAAVSGPKSIPKKELELIGQEFLDKIVQQYAYQQVVNELSNKGFSIIEEKSEEDGRIRLKVRKFE